MGAEEVLDPGPQSYGGVPFVYVRHPVTGGAAQIPETNVAYWSSRGWEVYDPATPPEVAAIADEVSTSMRRADLDTAATRAGVLDPGSYGSKQAVIDAINDIAPSTDTPSSRDDSNVQEDS